MAARRAQVSDGVQRVAVCVVAGVPFGLLYTAVFGHFRSSQVPAALASYGCFLLGGAVGWGIARLLLRRPLVVTSMWVYFAFGVSGQSMQNGMDGYSPGTCQGV